jgi:hypothetical protein
MNWFFNAGDLDFFWKEQIQTFSWLPQIFHTNIGFGVSVLNALWINYPFLLIIKTLSSFGIDWFIIEKLFWVSVLVLALFSSYKLSKYVVRGKIYAILASVIYTTNTYAILLFGGGQLGVAFAYALSPFVLLHFIKTLDAEIEYKRFFSHGFLNGLLFSLLIVFDLRLAYLIAAATALYQIFTRNVRRYVHLILFTFGVPCIVVLFVHAFWILPVFVGGGGLSSLGEQFTNPGMLKFLSFADFSHAISLLHPNWPENLFGKVYFLQPEFLILPLLAFSSFLFIKRKKPDTKKLVFFGFIALLGAFLTKGVNEPFGGIYDWLFRYVPGFIMFRDPTKFYLFTAIGYSVLIPFTLSKLPSRIRNAGVILFIIYWCFTIRAVFTGQVTGNFRPLILTSEYIQLKDELVNDAVPSRTLWIPGPDKFVFSSDIHPVLSSNELFHNASVGAMIDSINTPDFERTVRDNGVGYVIVPKDPEKKMFLTDYKFDATLRENLINTLNNSVLQREPAYKDLKVYKIGHDPMIIKLPENIDRLQYWANVGTVISGLSLVIVFGLILVIRK